MCVELCIDQAAAGMARVTPRRKQRIVGQIDRGKRIRLCLTTVAIMNNW